MSTFPKVSFLEETLEIVGNSSSLQNKKLRFRKQLFCPYQKSFNYLQISTNDLKPP